MSTASAPSAAGSAPAATAPAAPTPASSAVLRFVPIGVLLGLSQGLGPGFLSANLPQIAGDLGVSATDDSLLMVAYMAPRATLPLLLTKLRTQYGVARFARAGALAYALMAFATCFITDFRSAFVLHLLMGCAAAPLSTLAFLYCLESLPQARKLTFGLPLALAVIMTAPNLARVLSPWLVGDGGFLRVHLFLLGLSLVALALVLSFPLAPSPTAKVLVPLDLLSFALLSAAFSGITAAAVMGPIYWWTATPWIGPLIALSLLLLAGVIIVELGRKAPMIDFRWLASPAMLQMLGAMLIFRLLLSEQSTGAPRMFQVLGHGPEQLTGLFLCISLASLAAPLAYHFWFRPGREPWFHTIALMLIAFGAWLDSRSTTQTLPMDMALSQSIIAFAGMLFMPSAMIRGLLSALKKGMSYILSFIIVFIVSQSIGGVAGSGLFTSFVNQRQMLHYQALTEELLPGSPLVQGQIAARAAAYGLALADPVALRQQAVMSLAEEASRQSWVMAYNDGYLVTAAAALVALAILALRQLHVSMCARLAPPSPAAPPVPPGPPQASPAPAPAPAAASPSSHDPLPMNKSFVLPAAVTAALGLAGAALVLYTWHLPPFASHHAKTENAYVRGKVTTLSAQVSGTIAEVLVTDFQEVKAGEVLIRLDRGSLAEKLHQAQADLASARASRDVAEKTLRSAELAASANVKRLEAARLSLETAEAEAARQEALQKSGVVSSAAKDKVDLDLRKAEAALAQLEAELSAEEQKIAALRGALASAEAAIASREAALALAQIDLEHAEIRAPADGSLGQITARVGQYVSAGTAVASHVGAERWVIANFTETSLPDLAPGQEVRVSVDALGHQVLTGHISRFSPAAASEYSLIPATNATGNFTKVVQRVPVRIEIDPGQPLARALAPGMSVVVETF